MKHFPTILLTSFFCTILPCISHAEVELYTGAMDVVSVSGRACAGLTGKHTVSLVLRKNENGLAVSGFFGGKGITTGKFSGSNRSKLAVRYPYHDPFRATGHFISIIPGENSIRAELHDRHIESDVDDCNFDLAQMTLNLTGSGKIAEERLQLFSSFYDAQLMRSEAFSLARAGNYDKALPLYEKALALAEPASIGNEALLAPYITGLANAYVKLGRFDSFNRLYDQRAGSITDEGVRTIFTGHRVSSLLKTGKTFLMREEFPAALEAFQKAVQLQPESREAIAAVMTVHLRAGNIDTAIVFLSETLKNIENVKVKQDVTGALAHAYFLRAKKLEKAGKVAEAEADLKSADALDSSSAQYLIALARLRHKAGSLAEAEEMLDDGLKRFHLESTRQEIIAARDKMRLTEAILNKLRRTGG